MVDRLSRVKRSALMSRIRGKDTAPEMSVRRHLHASGLRYRLHAKALPGSPDLVFPSRRVCVFVHGCFWHACPHCNDGMHHVKTNRRYWRSKLVANSARDARTKKSLSDAGWRVIVIWECQTGSIRRIRDLEKAIRRSPFVRQSV
jgi:DNA mismatch endonuclease (patch repair protein)